MDSKNFVQGISKGLALDQKQARSASGILLGFIIQHASAETAKALLATLPWAHSLLGADRVPPMTSEHFKVSTAADAEQAKDLNRPPYRLGLLGALGEIGVTPDQTHVIVMRFLDFVARSAGEALAHEILQEVPDLDPFDESPAEDETPLHSGRSGRESTSCLS